MVAVLTGVSSSLRSNERTLVNASPSARGVCMISQSSRFVPWSVRVGKCGCAARIFRSSSRFSFSKRTHVSPTLALLEQEGKLSSPVSYSGASGSLSATTTCTASPMRRAAMSEPEVSIRRMVFGCARSLTSRTRILDGVPSPAKVQS